MQSAARRHAARNEPACVWQNYQILGVLNAADERQSARRRAAGRLTGMNGQGDAADDGREQRAAEDGVLHGDGASKRPPIITHRTNFSTRVSRASASRERRQGSTPLKGTQREQTAEPDSVARVVHWLSRFLTNGP